MIKRIVVAKDFHQFVTYCRNRQFLRDETGYYLAGRDDCIRGLPNDIPVHWLDGWSLNKNLTATDINELKARFTTHKEIPEWRIYGEGISF